MAGPAGWQGWRPQLLHGPGRGRCAASRVRSVRSRRVGSGSGVRSARPLEPPALQSGRSWWQPQGWRSRVLIARNARGCEGYRADPRQSSFGTWSHWQHPLHRPSSEEGTGQCATPGLRFSLCVVLSRLCLLTDLIRSFQQASGDRRSSLRKHVVE